MKLSIYARLVISYLVFCVMLAAVSVFFIYHLNRFNQVMQTIVMNDTAIVELTGLLSDALLAEARNERKYVLLKDDQYYRDYLEARSEFERLERKALLAAIDPEIREALLWVGSQHHEFTLQVEEERQLLQDGASYTAEWYETENKKITADIVGSLKNIQHISEQRVFANIRNLKAAGERIGGIAGLITLGALFIGLLVAAVITRSITKPLHIIKAKTRQIARGDFKCDLNIESPPTIKELALALNSMCHQLQELDNLKSAFFANMSHELRTPLASIKEGTNILLDGLSGDINGKQQRILTIITQESDRLINLVNSLLDLAKMEAGMLIEHFARTDLAALVRDTLQGLLPLAEAKGVRVINEINALPPVNIDQERIMQVIRNLVGNAIKFTPEQGVINLSATVRDTMVEVAVRDTGIGIPEGDLERIFLKFQQVLPARSDQIKGTGLGLATVKQIISAHGGSVWATSQPGNGSTFFFTLPLAA